MRRRHLKRLAASIALMLAAAEATAATITTIQDGAWFCENQTGSGCAFGTAGNVGAGDKAVIQHFASINGVPAEPKPELAGSVDITSGTLGIYGGMRLEFGGGTWSGGSLDACCSGGGTWANEGLLSIGANPFTVFGGVLENNGTLKVLSGATLLWTNPNAGPLANLTTGVTPAVVELVGTARIGAVNALSNEGIVRKSGAGTALVYGKIRNRGTSPIHPGSIEVLAGTLAIADEAGQQGLLVNEGAAIDVAEGAVLAIRDGGDMRLTPEAGATEVYTTTGTGAGQVRLEPGGRLIGDFRLPGNVATAVLDFDPGVLVWAGGNFENAAIRNEGEITITGPDAKSVAGVELENAGTMKLLSGTLGDAGVLNITAQGLLEAADGTGIAQTGNNPRLFVNGTLRKLAGAGTFAITNLVPEGTGRIEIDGGQFVLNEQVGFCREAALGEFGGTLELKQNAQASFSAATTNGRLKEGAALTGIGTVDVGFMAQRGRIEPGAPFGALVFTGALRQETFGDQGPVTTRITIGGTAPLTQYAQVQVAGDLRPFGVLAVNFVDLFSPQVGDVFDLITVGGNFTETTVANYTVVIEGLEPGFQYTLTQSPQKTVRLTALNHVESLLNKVFSDGFE